MSGKILAITLVALFLIVTVNSLAQKESARMTNRRALVQAEHDFAKAAATKGTREAFLEFLADDGIVFHPGPVNGKKSWQERPARKGLLSWEPVFADVSRAGDLGYTTGPWEFRPNSPDDKPVAFGQYFTIWKKQSDSSWKAVLDRGVSHEQPSVTAQLRFPKDDADAPPQDESRWSNRDTRLLMKLENEFSAASSSEGTAKAFGSCLADDVRLLRENSFPAEGKQAALALLLTKQGTLMWKPAMADISQSGDLGYTYGTFEFKGADNKSEHGSYVRVWKKDTGGKWRVVIDILSPDPQA
jgi:ketosteroid isomerase-like protein